jgi:F-type H+-transporting ATPase subunit gamma
VAICDVLAQRFLTGELDRVDVVYWHYVSSGKQELVEETLLPIQGSPGEGDAGGAASTDFIVDPDPKRIVQWIFPLWYRTNFYRMFLEAAASEQLARRSAMKAATDNANDMANSLNIRYNRARQAQITTEILEVIGGAEALK